MKITINEGFSELEIIINCVSENDEIRKIASVLRSFDQKLTGTKDDQTYIIDCSEVLYFDSVDKESFIYTSDQIFGTTLKLYEIEERLLKANFFRSSKSQIINIAKIRSLRPDFGGRIELKMINGEKLIVSRQYAKALKERLGLR